MKATRILAGIYILLCIGALFLLLASTNSWLGVEPDPLSGAYAFLLALPWALIASSIAEPPLWLAIVIMVVGMAANTMIIFGVGQWMARRRTDG